jgi:hypothetical protein
MKIKTHALMITALLLLLVAVGGSAAGGDDPASLSKITFYVA